MEFALVDVFATSPLTGNPLAVVAGADGLPDEVMRGLAREFNQSETTFVLKPTRAEAHARLRSFTPTGAEVFGAGHNALGAWWWLAESGQLDLRGPTTTLFQELGDRVLPLAIERDGANVRAVRMFQTVPSFRATVDPVDDLMLALGLTSRDVPPNLRPQTVSTGAAHLLVPVSSREAVDRAKPNAAVLFAMLQSVGAQGCYLFTTQAQEKHADAYARFFNPTVGIWEDPGTGSAAGPLACYLQRYAGGGDHVVIEQGHLMGRPSRIDVFLKGNDVSIHAHCATVATGQLTLPAHARRA